MVIVDNNVINGMAGMTAMVTMFPVLHHIKHRPTCGCHAGQVAHLYDDVKRQMGSLVGEPLNQVKQALGTAELRVIYRDTQGVMHDKTL